jgi:hypothetical protein
VVLSGCKRYEMSFSMVKEAIFYVPYTRLFACKILSIVGSQIEIERSFFLIGTLMNFKKYHLQSNNLGKIIFVKRN